MRETKFRGKSVETGEWVYGSLVQEDGKAWIVGGISIEDAGGVFDFYATEWYEVIPEIVGQYTGLKDKEGSEIYEGDILNYGDCLQSHEVIFKNGCFWGHTIGYGENIGIGLYNALEDLEIAGNIYDNPELLEVAK